MHCLRQFPYHTTNVKNAREQANERLRLTFLEFVYVETKQMQYKFIIDMIFDYISVSFSSFLQRLVFFFWSMVYEKQNQNDKTELNEKKDHNTAK